MPETPREKPESDIAEGKCDSDSWVVDQKKHEYYYDDAHGYETYDPEPDDDVEQENGDST